MRTRRRTAAGFAALAAMAVGFSLAATSGAMAAGQMSGEEADNTAVEVVEDPEVEEQALEGQSGHLAPGGAPSVAEQGMVATPQPMAAGAEAGRRVGPLVFDGVRPYFSHFFWVGDPITVGGASHNLSRYIWPGDGWDGWTYEMALKAAQDNAWKVSIPPFDTWGKIRFESGPYKGMCLQAKKSSLILNQADSSNGIHPAVCDPKANILQDFYVRETGFISALGTLPARPNSPPTDPLNRELPYVEIGILHKNAGMGGPRVFLGVGTEKALTVEPLNGVAGWPLLTEKPVDPVPPPGGGSKDDVHALELSVSHHCLSPFGPCTPEAGQPQNAEYPNAYVGQKLIFKYQVKDISKVDPQRDILWRHRIDLVGVPFAGGDTTKLECNGTSASNLPGYSVNKSKYNGNNQGVTSVVHQFDYYLPTTITCTAEYELTQADIDNRMVSFQIRALANDAKSPEGIHWTAPASLKATLTPRVLESDLSVTKSAPDYTRKGDVISWQVTVSNAAGGDTVPSYVVSDQLPDGIEFVGVDDGGRGGTGEYEDSTNLLQYVSGSTLLAGESHAITVKGRVLEGKDGPACGGEFTNTAEVLGNGVEELDPSNNEVTSGKTKVLCDKVSLTKEVNGRAAVGDEFTVQLLGAAGGELVAGTTDSTSLTNPDGVSVESVDQIVPGQAFMVAEMAASGSGADLANYDATLECTRSDTGDKLAATAAHESDRLRWQLTMPGFADLPDKEVTLACTLTNESLVVPVPVTSVSWSKVDDAGHLLEGSEWLITDGSGQKFDVKDCVEDSAADCTGLDEDPLPGEFLVEGLEPGEYTLVEVKAPAGFVLDGKVHSLTLDGSVSAVVVGPKGLGDTDGFINHPQSVAALPLTGVFGQAWVWVGGVLIVGMLLAMTLWVQSPRRKVG